MAGAALGLGEDATEHVIGQLEARLAEVDTAVAAVAVGALDVAVPAAATDVSDSMTKSPRVSGDKRRPRLLGLESLCPLVASGQWLPDMRVRAGAVDALGDVTGGPARVVEWAEVESSEADVIVICCCGRSAEGAAEEVRAHLLSRPAIWQLPAMRAVPPQLYVVAHDYFSRPGPRLVDGIETLVALLHPSLISPEVFNARTAEALQLVIEEPNSSNAALVKGGGRGGGNDGIASRSGYRFELVASSREPASPATAPVRTTPEVRSASAMVVAPNDDGSLILFGGERDISVERAVRGMGDVWKLMPPTAGWESCSCPEVRWSGPLECGAIANEDVPTARSNHAAVACGDHMLVFGGWSADGTSPLSHPELLHLETLCWTHCSTVNEPPSPRGNPTLVYSPRRHLVVVYGGWNRTERLDDCYCLDMESWRWILAAKDSGRAQQPEPCARTDHTAVLWCASATSERMLVFGGSTKRGASDELWSLNCSNGDPASWRWTIDEAEMGRGPWPAPRTSHAAAIAGSGESAALIIVGGQDGSLGPGIRTLLAELIAASPCLLHSLCQSPSFCHSLSLSSLRSICVGRGCRDCGRRLDLASARIETSHVEPAELARHLSVAEMPPLSRGGQWACDCVRRLRRRTHAR